MLRQGVPCQPCASCHHACITRAVAAGVEFLHAQSPTIVHLDLKVHTADGCVVVGCSFLTTPSHRQSQNVVLNRALTPKVCECVCFPCFVFSPFRPPSDTAHAFRR